MLDHGGILLVEKWERGSDPECIVIQTLRLETEMLDSLLRPGTQCAVIIVILKSA